MKKRTFHIQPVENGYIVTSTYQYKPKANDPGHSRTEQHVARTKRELFALLSERLNDPAVVFGNE